MTTDNATKKKPFWLSIEEHILGGNVVEEYVIDGELWDAPISPEAMMKQMGQ